MNEPTQYVVGTSGYSFDDWVGPFYPEKTRRGDMFAYYARHFSAVELNFTYYRIPTAEMMAKLADRSPTGFQFWVKANQQTTHKHNRDIADEFLAGVEPLATAGKLAGVLLQFPQSFHRTVANRKYLAEALDDLAGGPLAVEFRHCSWAEPAVNAALSQRDVTLVVPDCPDIAALYHTAPALTSRTGYLRLHSRNADNWYAGSAERYDYRYSQEQLHQLADQWSALAGQMDRLFVFFNNCHHAQAAENAADFQRIVDQMDA